MLKLKKYIIIVSLTLTIVVGIFNNIPSYAQEGNQTEENENSTKIGHSSEENEYNKTIPTTTVRDSVTILLQDAIIPGTDFLHLYDSTPSQIMNGHIALKVPCAADSSSPTQVLLGSAPNMTAATLENIPALSTPGEQCLYHVDLIPGGNVTTITDIALSNPTEDEIEFPPTSSVVIGINEVMEGEHAHTENVENATEGAHTE
ncbi:MAG: uncharacterized protein K0S93_155 [Nitrososphaeraceae archaeon]|jgi:hypothetical protein|nr:uncharacterized protein [Nitrososphaeraceae archaeon]